MNTLTVERTVDFGFVLQYRPPMTLDWETIEYPEDEADAEYLRDEYMMAFKAPESRFRIIDTADL